MFNNKNIVVGIKDQNGNIVLKDNNKDIRIPFDSEYSIFIKNNNGFDVGLELFIDGTKAINNYKIFLKARDKIELDRFCFDGDLESGAKFKFVAKDSSDVQDPTSEDNGNIKILAYKENINFWENKYANNNRLKISSGSGKIKTQGLGFERIMTGDTSQDVWKKSMSNAPLIESSLGGYYFSNDSNTGGSDNITFKSKNLSEKQGDSDNNIKILRGHEAVLKRPTMYPDVDVARVKNKEENFEEQPDIGATVEGGVSNQKFKINSKKINLESTPFSEITFYIKGIVRKKDNSKKNKYKNKVAFVLDKSGSMSQIRSEAIDAFNNQKKVLLENTPDNVETTISLFTFSTEAGEPILLDIPAEDLADLTNQGYIPSGSTAMLDSVGIAFEKLSNLPDSHEENTSFLMVIISDGQENASRSYDYEDISNIISNFQNTGKWTITYLGANQDLSEVSKKMNLHKGNIQLFSADSAGMKAATAVLSNKTSTFVESLGQGKKSSQGFYSQ